MCEKCVLSWKQENFNNSQLETCPICRTSPFNCSPCKELNMAIADIPTECRFVSRGCEAHNLTRKSMHQHLQECPYRNEPCPAHKYGCVWMGKANQIHSHISQCRYCDFSRLDRYKKKTYQEFEEFFGKKQKELDSKLDSMQQIMTKSNRILAKNVHRIQKIDQLIQSDNATQFIFRVKTHSHPLKVAYYQKQILLCLKIKVEDDIKIFIAPTDDMKINYPLFLLGYMYCDGEKGYVCIECSIDSKESELQIHELKTPLSKNILNITFILRSY